MARRVGAWGRCSPEASWGQEPQTSVFISSHRLRPALGVSARKARGRGGDPKSSSPGQATPWHPCAGRVGHTICESRSFPLPSAQTAPWARVWVWEGVGGWQITHFRPPCLLSPAFCSWGPFLWRMRTHSFQEVIPKPLARDPAEPETRGAERSKTAWNT